MGARHISRLARTCGLAVAVAMTVAVAAPLPARAQAPQPAPAAASPPTAASPAQDPPPEPAQGTSNGAAATPTKEPAPPTKEITAPPPQQQTQLVAPPNNVSQGAGLGSAVATTDPESRRAKAELEGTALPGKAAEGVPDRLPPLQRGGWWCVFGAFALASTGGVFAGLAEAQEDRAARWVAQIDTDTGAALQYSEVQAEYQDTLDRGRRDAILARSFIAAGGVVLAAGIGLFIADSVKRKRSARVSAGMGGLQVRF